MKKLSTLWKGTDTKYKRCEVDRTRIITNDYWAVSLVRLPHSSNDEHAFLVLEGIKGNKSMIWFADFVANSLDLLLPGIRGGKVRIDYHESEGIAGSSNKLLIQCHKKLMQVREGDRWLNKTWHIRKDTAQMLINNIEDQKKDPPKYNILGDSMVAASSATSSSNATGHNCFTFAKMMLNDLDDEYIKVPQDTLEDWICSVTSRYLVDNQMNNKLSLSWWYALPVTVLVAAISLAFYLGRKTRGSGSFSFLAQLKYN